ncbi:YneF family protein [Carnobacterium gallinarum]|uniref:YneF family protein n=1 Tax=Carnobacterium gallinarum TaxID=2749 RepID=UPI0005514D05|nr:YneF family protein [Carnobacterium gallinarum]
MNIWLSIGLIILALVGGAVGGYFLARKTMMDYFKKNPPVNEDMLRMLMMQMGQKPSEKKIKQMMASMQVQTEKANKKK